MTPAAPERGSIIRYAYLWVDEQARGREEGRKDRPTLVLALSVRAADGNVEILVLPITHLPPARAQDAVPIPPDVKRRLGLDEAPSWIVTTEANAFDWPGPDLRPVPGRSPSTVIYGRIPDALVGRAARSFLANRERRLNRLVRRTR